MSKLRLECKMKFKKRYKRAVCGGAHLGPNSLEAEAGNLQSEFQDGQCNPV